MSKRIFKDIAHQELFDKQGFIVLTFLEKEEIDELNSFFDQEHPELGENGFFSGSYSSDYSYKKKASDKIVSIFSRAYEKYFIDYKPFGGAFLYKTPGSKSELAAHQDWTIVDEENELALNCWVPLCDISLDNGPLMILPGSQYSKHPVVRAPTLAFFFSGNDDLVMKELEPMLVKAGTAVILNQSVIHYSLPNQSSAVRKAITAGVKSENAQMYFHYKLPEEDKLEVFQEDDDFLIRFENFAKDIGQRPKLGSSIGFKEYKLPTYSRADLQSLIAKLKTDAGFALKTPQEEPIPTKQSFMDKIKAWF
ncbi:MAG: phytanoyl-CoA dioxygenase family protein [Chitinophagales bacterium]|nr:phytanoyl-CoA dioxygenase family protein [Chitinophagales bacterium]